MVSNLLADERGQGTTEYALIVVLIAVGLIATLVAFKGAIISKFTEITDGIAAAG